MNESNAHELFQDRRVDEDRFYEVIVTAHERLWNGLLPTQIPTGDLSVRLEFAVVTPRDAPIPDCTTCGACCAAMLCTGVRPGEESRLEEADYWEVTRGEGADSIVVDRFLRRDPETLYCSLLEVAGEVTTCRIYADRPRMCRDFEAGSDKCHALRRAYGKEPFLALDEMSHALERLRGRASRFDPATTIAAAKFTELESGRVLITARLMNGDSIDIHEFSPGETTFMQFEFDSLTLEQAAELIAEREG